MDFKDYYKTLGLDKNATPEQIKSAYKTLVKKHHPDVNKGDSTSNEKIKEINEAYDVLSDAEKKKKYDNLGSSWNRFNSGGGRADDFDWDSWSSGSSRRRSAPKETVGDFFNSGGGVSDFFDRIFGAGKGYSQKQGFNYPPTRGEDVNSELTLTLEEAFKGCSKIVQNRSQKIEMKIKAGITDGQTLKISGKGKFGKRGGEPGDLIVKVNIEEHARVKRGGDDLFMEAPIDLYVAVLGGAARVSTFAGTIKMTIPPESLQGKVMKLTGQGMPKYSNPDERGDLFITLQIKLPQNLSEKEVDLFKQLKALRATKDYD